MVIVFAHENCIMFVYVSSLHCAKTKQAHASINVKFPASTKWFNHLTCCSELEVNSNVVVAMCLQSFFFSS